MASLKDIRRRISSVKNTQQITKAMKMVAAAKLRRAQTAIASAKPFAQKLETLAGRIISEIQKGSSLSADKRVEFLKGLHPLLAPPAPKSDVFGEGPKSKVALLVVSSDRGLCGAYNTNAVKFAFKRYNELIADTSVSVSLYFVGRKGYEFFKKRGLEGHWFSTFWSGKFTTSKSDKVARELTDHFLSGEFQSIEASFTEFRSAISQTASNKQILPLSLAAAGISTQGDTQQAATEENLPFKYEPSREWVLSEVLPNLVRTQFYRIFADSLASEFGARMTSMDNASRNAGEMIGSLTLQANRVRQASITKELMEIVGGAEALKG